MELGVDDFIVVLVGLVVDDLQDLNEAEGGPQPSQDDSWSGSSLAMGAGRLSPRWFVASGPEVQVHPAALPLQFIGSRPCSGLIRASRWYRLDAALTTRYREVQGFLPIAAVAQVTIRPSRTGEHAVGAVVPASAVIGIDLGIPHADHGEFAVGGDLVEFGPQVMLGSDP